MTKILVNFTRKIVYLLSLQNSGYIYFGIIIPAMLRENIVKVVSRYVPSNEKLEHRSIVRPLACILRRYLKK